MIKNQPIFILGAPRSGTTFLASLLEYTEYGAPFETHFITKYYKKLHQYGDITKLDNFKKLLSDILKERAVMQWELSLDIGQFYKDINNDYSFSNITNQLCLKRISRNKTTAWGDKTPHYLGDFEIIYELFPHAKFLYIVRDGRDVALSLLQKNWGPNNIYTCAKYWKMLNRDSKEIEKLKEQKQLFFLRYEDLLDDTNNIVNQIYSFLQQDCDKKNIQMLCSTVKAGNYYKWKKKLNNRQIKIFDQVAGNTLKKFGYETFHKESNVNLFEKTIYSLHDKLLFYKFMFEINVIDGIKIRYFGKKPFAE